MTLHPQQKNAIEADCTTVVSAGAGSGKTMVLTRRYIRLIASGAAEVDTLLTLTFTRKAAAEMRERIQSALLQASRDAQYSTAEQRRLQTAAAQFPRALVMTLDSYCSRIVRESARSYGVTPEFTTDEKRIAELLEQECLSFIAEHRQRPGLQAWLRDSGMEGVLRKGMLPLASDEFSLAHPIDWQQLGEQVLDLHRQEVRNQLQLAGELTAALPAGEDFDNKFLAAMQQCIGLDGLDFSDTSPEGCEKIMQFCRQAAAAPVRSAPRKESLREIVEAMKQLRNLARNELPLAIKGLAVEPVYRDLSELMGLLQERVLERKRSSGLLSFNDVAQLALHALLTQPELRQHHNRSVSHIMIDEFQDNNQLQQDLLFALSLHDPWDDRVFESPPTIEDIAGNKLFFVGDEKQSIFGFRGADVAVFRGLSEQVGHAGGQALPLSVNFRSEPALIGLFNAVFPVVFGQARETYEARFEELEPRAAADGVVPCIEVWSAESRRRKSARSEDEADAALMNNAESEAEYMASWLAERIASRDLLVPADNGGTRPVEFRDCAVLFRSGGSVMSFEEAFRRHGIPYNSMIMRSLFLEAPANDLYAALQTAIYPEDRTAYAAVLRSPLVGIGDDSLVRLLLQADMPAYPGEAELIKLGIPGSDRSRMLQAAGMQQNLREMAGRCSPVELLDYLWYDCGYRYSLLHSPANHPYLEHYEYLREWFSRPNMRLTQLLQELRERLGENEKYEGEDIVREQQDAVTILTVHSSKGLGFPVVLAARCSQQPSNRSGADPLGHYHGIPIFLLSDPDSSLQNRKNLLIKLAEDERKAQDTAELKRLLYVAMTRAKQHLVLSGVERVQDSKKDYLNDARNFGDLLIAGLGIEDIDEQLLQVGAVRVQQRVIPSYPEEVGRHRREKPRIGFADAAQRLRQNSLSIPEHHSGVMGVTELARLLRSGEVQQAVTAGGVPLNGYPADSFSLRGVRELPMIAVDDLIEQLEWEDRFGSLCHYILEQRLIRPDAAIVKDEIAYQAAGRFQSRLENEVWQSLWEAAWQLTQTWLAGEAATELGAVAGTALPKGVFVPHVVPVVQVEREFLCRVSVDGRDVAVSGIIDVTIEHADQVTVLDYKTDRHWDPLHHYVQLVLYREAAATITGKTARACLAPLRSGELQWLER